MKRYNVWPSKESSLLAFCMGIFMSVIGLILFFMLLGSSQWFGVIFVLMWTFGAVGITIYHGKNAFSQTGVPSEHIEYEETGQPSFDEDLRKLKGLLDDGIINQAEFDRKKAEILGKKW